MSGARVYIGHLPSHATERDLEHFFRGYGRITYVQLLDGFAFVDFDDSRDADDAVYDLNGRELLGQRVIVELSRTGPKVGLYRKICDDIWYGVFASSERADLGLKIAPLCARFDGLADRHFRTIKWTLGHIVIGCATNGSSAEVFKGGQENGGVILAESALLDVPLPPKLVGFKRIEIKYMDQNVIAFLHRIGHIFNNADTTLTLPILPLHSKIDEWRSFVTHFWPFIAKGLYRLCANSNCNILPLRTLISPTVLRDCANLQIIDSTYSIPELPADDRADASESQAMAMWLHTPRSDGRPKVLKCRSANNDFGTNLERLKRAFLDAESSVSFIINLISGQDDVEPFECENGRTRERMTFQRYRYFWLLRRGPILWGKNEWADSECEAMLSWDLSKKMNLISCVDITFNKNFV